MLIPYLSFCGNCEEAFNLYISAFGGEIRYLSRFTAETGTPDKVGKVMHVEALVGDSVISGADNRTPEEMANSNNNFMLMVHCASRQEAERYIDKLSEGGQVIQRLMPHPPPDDDGMGSLVQDKFGYQWCFTAPNDLK